MKKLLFTICLLCALAVAAVGCSPKDVARADALVEGVKAAYLTDADGKVEMYATMPTNAIPSPVWSRS